MPSQNVEEYLEAIYRLGGEKGRVNTCDLAEQLGVAPPSVTTMIRRMSRDGLIQHVRYHGITLTALGHEMAVSMIRRHRLSERLLTDVLGMPWERVHDAACKLEHVLTGEIEEKAYQALGEPERCPHGHLLSGAEETTLVQLSCVAPGTKVCVVKLTDEREDFLKHASNVGLVPSQEIEVESNDNEIALIIGENKTSIKREYAEHIWVRLPAAPTSDS